MASATVTFPSVPGTVSYDIYRSADPIAMGDKINLASVPQPGSGDLIYTDDAVNSTSAPELGNVYWYRAVPFDGGGQRGIPSSAVMVNLAETPYVIDDIQKKMYEAMAADATLIALLGGQAIGKILWQHPPKTATPTGPYIVFWRAGWKEDKNWRSDDERHGTGVYAFQCWHDKHDSQVIKNILNRIVKILDGRLDLLVTCSVTPMSIIFDEGSPELYDDQIMQWFSEQRCSVIVELRDV